MDKNSIFITKNKKYRIEPKENQKKPKENQRNQKKEKDKLTTLLKYNSDNIEVQFFY